MAENNHTRLLEKGSLDVLVVGNGGREHAIAWKIRQAKRAGRVLVAPGMGGLDEDIEQIGVDLDSPEDIARLAIEQEIDLVFIGPDDALANGTIDRLGALGIAAFGPDEASARIESSKPFAKDLMRDNGIPTASYKNHFTATSAHHHIDALNGDVDVFIKAGGLARGKGAERADSAHKAHELIDNLMVKRVLGGAGQEIVIESVLTGQEVSLHALSSGLQRKMFLSAQDYKQIGVGDSGKMTGGVGTIAPVPWFGPEMVENAAVQVVDPALAGLAKQSAFRGMLYPGLMVNQNGLAVVEYNARFGDPETQVFMRLLKSDLLELIVKTVVGELEDIELEWHDGHAICVIAVSGGYPETYQTGKLISGIDKFQGSDDVVLFNAGVAEEDGRLYTSGGRVIGATVIRSSLEEANAAANEAIDQIKFDGKYFREDIGLRPSPL